MTALPDNDELAAMLDRATKGPWVADDWTYCDGVTILTEDGFAVADAPNTIILQGYEEKLGIGHWANDERAHRHLNEDEQAANAALIALAPALAEEVIRLRAGMTVQAAAKVLLGEFDNDQSSVEWLSVYRAMADEEYGDRPATLHAAIRALAGDPS